MSKAIIICGSWISFGMKGEIKLAAELDIPAYVMLEHADGAVMVKITQEDIIDEMQVCKRNIS